MENNMLKFKKIKFYAIPIYPSKNDLMSNIQF